MQRDLQACAPDVNQKSTQYNIKDTRSDLTAQAAAFQTFEGLLWLQLMGTYNE
jgi:hypothetical protein